MDEFADDFVFLSDDIIHDVLQFAHFERLRTNSPNIGLFGGRWGKIVEKFCTFRLLDNKIDEYRLNGHSVPFTAAAKNRKDVAVNKMCLYEIREFNKIQHLAANAYESLEVHCDVIPKEFLENLGNRFTSIIWRNGEGRTEEIDFLTRQLKSPHLRILECNSPVLARPDFTDLLVDFVKKKNFQTLNDSSFSRKGISERLFLAAYEVWLQRSEREHLRSSISGWISTEDLSKLTARIPNFSWNELIKGSVTEWSFSEKHPTADHYEMRLSYDDFNFGPSDVKALTMTLSREDRKNLR